LKGEHGCSDQEISQLKATCKFRVMNFFHQICGLCDKFLVSRDESIEHIKYHFRDISERPNPPEDLGASEWIEKCDSDHKLKRGVHYHVNKNKNGNFLNRDRDHDDSGGPSQEDPNTHSHDNSQDQHDKSSSSDGDSGLADDSSFYSSQSFSHTEYGQYSTGSSHSCAESAHGNDEPSICSSYELEGLTFQFTSLQKLGNGGRGQADEIMSSTSKETFARKSVIRKQTKPPTSSAMVDLKNELAVIKVLNYSQLAKLVRAHTDAEYS